MSKTKRSKPTPRKKPADFIDAQLPVPPALEGLRLSDVSRAYEAVQTLDTLDRAQTHLRAAKAELAKIGIRLRGVDAVVAGGR